MSPAWCHILTVLAGTPRQPAIWVRVSMPAPRSRCSRLRGPYSLEAGEPGRPLANGDVLRIEAVTNAGLMVRRLLGADPATGQRRFTERTFCYAGLPVL